MKSDVHDPERARRFRDIALPHLDEVYTLARYLLRNTADAEDAVQECYLRALKHFDTFRGGAIRPWLFAIVRNVCH
jgi:RNA polymerase sigma-70 factor (ECF subfamily)